MQQQRQTANGQKMGVEMGKWEFESGGRGSVCPL